jgi:hypothetical protein
VIGSANQAGIVQSATVHRLLSRGFVVCRIQVQSEEGRAVVRLAGHLSGAQVPDLLAACADGSRHPRVELDELLSADIVGLDALLRVEERGAVLVGLLEYLQFELDALRRKRP